MAADDWKGLRQWVPGLRSRRPTERVDSWRADTAQGFTVGTLSGAFLAWLDGHPVLPAALIVAAFSAGATTGVGWWRRRRAV